MELLDAHRTAMSWFDAHVRRVRPEQWDAPTPCADWSVRDLVNHIVAEQLWAPPLLSGSTVEQVGGRFDGDQLGDDPAAAWERASDAARGAWNRPGVLQSTVHLSRGPAPAPTYGWEMTSDLAVHGWDLARGIGSDDPIDDELAETLLARLEPKYRNRRPSALFAAPVDVPADARASDRLVALLGRDPSWAGSWHRVL